LIDLYTVKIPNVLNCFRKRSFLFIELMHALCFAVVNAQNSGLFERNED
jgi:hypothetical protein